MAIATHDLVPFIVAILVMALASEFAAVCNRSSAIRVWVAASADIAVCALIYIASRPADSRMDYKQVSEWLLLTLGPILLLLYGASATAQTVLRSRKITFSKHRKHSSHSCWPRGASSHFGQEQAQSHWD